MTFSLSFSPAFFGGTTDSDEVEQTDRPTSVLQAIVSLTDRQRAELARNVFDCQADELSHDGILQKVVETDTCTDLTSPVEVWIDCDGFHALLVHDELPKVP